MVTASFSTAGVERVVLEVDGECGGVSVCIVLKDGSDVLTVAYIHNGKVLVHDALDRGVEIREGFSRDYQRD